MWEHLQKILEAGSFRAALSNMLREERLVGLAIQTSVARIAPRLSKKTAKLPRQDETDATPPANPLNHPLFQQVRNPIFQIGAEGLFALNGIENQKILRGESCQPFLADLFQEANEIRILYLAAQRDRHLMSIRPAEVWPWFPLLNRFLEHTVGTLARPLNQSAPAAGFSDPPVPRRLLPQKVLDRNAIGKPAWTHDL